MAAAAEPSGAGDGMARILIGTSGWDYKEWVGPFYASPDGLFKQYCSVFSTVEVNSTFYRYPTPSLIRGLARASPRRFVFSLKMPKLVTHTKRFNPRLGVGEDVERFLRLVEPLVRADKLGAVLVQLPPVSREEAPYFDEFLDLLPTDRVRFAVEFRDPSWLVPEVIESLRSRGVAYCILDEPLLPPTTYVTSDFAYIRWHGRGESPWYYYLYSEEELREWVPRIREVCSAGAELVLGYFNNHFRGFAPRDALQMLKLLGLQTFTQEMTLSLMERRWAAESRRRGARCALDALRSGQGVEGVLACFTDGRRLARAKEMPDSALRLLEIGDQVIRARVKDYIVEVDLRDRVVRHNCEDWRKGAELGRFCKHVAKLFLALPEGVAMRVLSDIAENVERWRFIWVKG
ncbi:MAG: hypothetical protein DRJ56_08900 [Thermoprotei archaeon]|nr:MAG: hypothetical protein DRJ56_08900 [Thermoprotei archaeon]